MCPKPFIWAENESRLARENLTIYNTTQRNLVDAESHWSEPKLYQEMKENFFWREIGSQEDRF